MTECFDLKREQITNFHDSHKFRGYFFFYNQMTEKMNPCHTTVHNHPTISCSSWDVIEREDYEVGLIDVSNAVKAIKYVLSPDIFVKAFNLIY